MPEAVIVATGRTPIGRANKGSLVECRPDDLSALVIRAVLEQGARSSTPPRSRTCILGCGQPAGEAGYNVARVAAILAGLRRRARRHGQPLLLVLAADDPHGGPRHPGRRGRRLRRRRRRDGEPLHARRVGHRPAQPGVRRGRGAHQGPRARRHRAVDPARPACPTSTSPWARRPRTWPSTRRSAAQEMDEFALLSQTRAVESQENGFFEREIIPVTLSDGTVVTKDDGPRPEHHPRGAGQPASRSSARAARSRPATPARSTTAPPPSS